MQTDRYIVRADEPFRGYVQSVLRDDGTVAYTEGLTLEQYAKERGFLVRVIDETELSALIASFTQEMITAPREESPKQYDDALNVLPPCRWHTHRSVNLFHVSERLYDNIVSWHAKVGDRCFTFDDVDNATSDYLASKVAESAR